MLQPYREAGTEITFPLLDRYAPRSAPTGTQNVPDVEFSTTSFVVLGIRGCVVLLISHCNMTFRCAEPRSVGKQKVEKQVAVSGSYLRVSKTA